MIDVYIINQSDERKEVFIFIFKILVTLYILDVALYTGEEPARETFSVNFRLIHYRHRFSSCLFQFVGWKYLKFYFIWSYARAHAPDISFLVVQYFCLLPWMYGNTRRYKVRNEDIRIKIGVASIKEKMRENRLRWLDHVRCRPTDAPVWRVERINLGQVKRAQGRPKKTWMEVIQ